MNDDEKISRYDELIDHADELILEVESFLSKYRFSLQREIYSKYNFYDDEGYYQEETDFIEPDFSDYSCEDIHICRNLLGEADYLKDIPQYDTVLTIGRLAYGVRNWYLEKEKGNIQEMMFLSSFLFFCMGKLKNSSELEELIEKKYKSSFAKRGALGRLANDPKQHAMSQIEQEYITRWNNGYRFPHGRLKQFYVEMAEKNFGGKSAEVKVDQISIKNRIEKLRRELGHS